MFGASEDRARQLAGRQRKKRISSTGSYASYRSASSSSQLSQLSHYEASSIFEQNIQRPTTIPEHYTSPIHDSHVDRHDSEKSQSLAQYTVASAVEEALSHMMAKSQHPRIQQQRIQAEHLSQVLYNDATVNSVLLSSSSCSVLPSQPKQYGILGWGAKFLHQSRRATEPSPQSCADDEQSTEAAATEITNRSMSTDFNSIQTVVSLRGGAEDPSEGFWTKASQHGFFRHPFNTGPRYREFVDSLSPEKRETFIALFDEATAVSGPINSARRTFYQDLNAQDRENFEYSAIRRALTLIGTTLVPGSTQTFDEMHHIFLTSVEGEEYPIVTLERLVMAMPLPYNIVDRAKHGYYSGGGGSSNASAATRATLNKLFDKYRENATGEPDLVGVDGTMSYLQQLEVDLEGMDSLAALEIIQAPTMGEITREGFVSGWIERDCDTIDKQKAYIKNLKTQLPADKTVFTRVYKYTFFLAKTGQQKAVPLEAAVAYWDLLFDSPLSAVKWSTPDTPWLDWWKEFLEVSWKKSVNKDMWNETLKFAQLTLQDEAISFWNEESSWPSVIDDFVEWVKNEKRGGAEQKTEEMEY